MNKKIIITVSSVALVILCAFILNRMLRNGFSSNSKISSDGVSFSELNAQAKEAESKGELLKAQSIYQKLVSEFSSSPEVMSWQKKKEELNIKLLFSPQATANSKIYEIKPGDTLARIAKEFNTTIELIMKSNNLASDRIMPGKKIKVWTAPFNILVDKSQNILVLKTKDEEIIKTYVVATGANNSTPVGTFTIIDRIPNPPWFKPGAAKPIPAGDPENILGTRWLGISVPSYGIHGTTEPQSLGKQATQGCVRMANSDVEELYAIVPKGTEVIIVD